MERVIRPATKEDVKEMLAIYAPYVTDTTVSFEYEVPSEKEFAARLEKVSAFYPWLVCEEDGQVLGYAYAGAFHERKAYQWDAELSIYVDRSCHKKGIGKELYEKLFEILKLQGIYLLYAHITYPNDDSIAFHEAMGFQKIAHFPKTGYKLGQWRDTIFMEKRLSPLPDKPADPHAADMERIFQ
ncbi:MAG: N-acetyltransferase family protein [Lachnospiraceae bacterium]|nr:N-acetyltransferase family protein [Robinsoniella sp.]MDY3767087.1 N-acetyltransferase family protein [Lachnospiraceae bacterium]